MADRQPSRSPGLAPQTTAYSAGVLPAKRRFARNHVRSASTLKSWRLEVMSALARTANIDQPAGPINAAKSAVHPRQSGITPSANPPDALAFLISRRYNF